MVLTAPKSKFSLNVQVVGYSVNVAKSVWEGSMVRWTETSSN